MLAILANDRPTARNLVVRSLAAPSPPRASPRHSIDGVQADEAAEDAFRRGAIQLLMRDGARQRMERRMLGAGGMREFAGGTDQVGKDRVDFGEPPFEGREFGRACTSRQECSRG